MVQNTNKKYEIDVLRNPTTIKLLAQQIKTASDAYVSRRITEKEYRELILYYATYHGKKLFSLSGSLNPTVVNRIGKKRCELVELMLRDFQLSIF
ncbi:MAG TPA: TIGR04540 family protein [Clostridia bacterium]|nr:TIGR04540 family protein [Clostridia bacterium]HQH66669.1 TIGR04540 family protein [Clostridia bacterium]HQK54880.1 TIGR04540 family protein [Sedimentibacter sp.]